MNWGMLGDLVLGRDVPFVSYFVVLLHIFWFSSHIEEISCYIICKENKSGIKENIPSLSRILELSVDLLSRVLTSGVVVVLADI